MVRVRCGNYSDEVGLERLPGNDGFKRGGGGGGGGGGGVRPPPAALFAGQPLYPSFAGSSPDSIPKVPQCRDDVMQMSGATSCTVQALAPAGRWSRQPIAAPFCRPRHGGTVWKA
jgi:hypothetical protein